MYSIATLCGCLKRISIYIPIHPVRNESRERCKANIIKFDKGMHYFYRDVASCVSPWFHNFIVIIKAQLLLSAKGRTRGRSASGRQIHLWWTHSVLPHCGTTWDGEKNTYFITFGLLPASALLNDIVRTAVRRNSGDTYSIVFYKNI